MNVLGNTLGDYLGETYRMNLKRWILGQDIWTRETKRTSTTECKCSTI